MADRKTEGSEDTEAMGSQQRSSVKPQRLSAGLTGLTGADGGIYPLRGAEAAANSRRSPAHGPSREQDVMRAPVYELGRVTADLVVLTVLDEEYSAVLDCVHNPAQLPGTHEHRNTHAWQLGTLQSRLYREPFRIVIGKGNQTNSNGALAAREAIHLFSPSYVVFVGISGGLDPERQRHGDVAVSSAVVAYEYGKLDTGGFTPRSDFHYPCDTGLLKSAEATIAAKARWWGNATKRGRVPRVLTGIIASGDKVVDDPDKTFFVELRKHWPKLLAVEMEGGGVAAAVEHARAEGKPASFVLVRGISDMPHAKMPGEAASTKERDRWKQTASRNAARFLAHLVSDRWPVPPRPDPVAVRARTAVGTEAPTDGASKGGATVSEAPPTPAYANPKVQARSEQLQAARMRKRSIARVNNEVDLDIFKLRRKLDRQILDLSRKLREGGQLQAGDLLGDGRYLLIQRVGNGGFGVVWDAFDNDKSRRVAIKVLHLHESERREHFFWGAQVMMKLEHPGVVRILDPGGEDGAFCYFVMELMSGGNLRDAVLERRIESQRILRLVLKVGEALAAAHRQRLVHRDVKPQNILLDVDGNAKLTDFDLVGTDDTSVWTRTGAPGTFVYAAPELTDRPRDATARVDVYGLGMSAIFCLSGTNLSMKTFRNPDATIKQLGCSARVQQVLAQAVAWEPDHRFEDAAAMVDALRRALDGNADDDKDDVADMDFEPDPPLDFDVASTSDRDREPHRPVGSRPPKDDDELTPRWAAESGEDNYGFWADFDVNGVKQRMRWIPAGTFQMGSPSSERGRYDEEGPQHQVTLTHGYWLGETPVTQVLWGAVMGNNPSRFRGHRAEERKRPVEHVSWDDCGAFLDQLNTQVAGLAARLPTEAEWERACRAGTTTATWAGELSDDTHTTELDSIAWYGPNSDGKTHPLGRKVPNPYGLHDMLGNVFEWCQDSLEVYPSVPAEDPMSHGQDSARVVRGGCYNDNARRVRAAFRYKVPRDDRLPDVGFRLSAGQESASDRSRRSEGEPRSGAPKRGEGHNTPNASGLDETMPTETSAAATLGEVLIGTHATSGAARRVMDASTAHVEVGEPAATPHEDTDERMRDVEKPWAASGEDSHGRWAAFAVKGVRQRMRWIPPGRFLMGSPETESARFSDERPQHWVTVTKGYWLGETQVTQAMWRAVMGENPSWFVSDDRPVEQVSWDDCQAFIFRINQMLNGLETRLPTEAEWERACRAETTSATWVGDLTLHGEHNAPELDAIAWYGGNSGCDFELDKGFDSGAGLGSSTSIAKLVRTLYCARSPIPMGSMTCSETCSSGARTRQMLRCRRTPPRHRSILCRREAVLSGSTAAGRGVTLRCTYARRTAG